MIRYFIITSCVVWSLFSYWKKDPVPEFVNSELYKTLQKEDYSDQDKEKILYIIVGIDYISNDLIQIFENLTGIKVIVDIFDSNEILEAKLLAGSIQYDVVFPTAWPNFSRQIQTGIYQKIDKTKLDFSIFDKDLLEKSAQHDAENSYSAPYQFGISGIGINEEIVDQLIENAPKDSWKLIFDPEYAKKLKKYRISLSDSQNEIFPAVLAYLGLNPETICEDDIKKAAEHLKKIRPYIAKFTSFGFEDIASENACAVMSTSGDIWQIRDKNNNKNIKFLSPKEGASLWVDVVAIPIDAKHLKNIYVFFKFLFHPQVIAHITNKTSRANAVVASLPFVETNLQNNTDIYPTSEVRKKCYIEKQLPANIERLKNNLLTKIKSMEY